MWGNEETIMTEKIQTNINTGSTGGLGFGYRSYNRAYLNYPGVVHDAQLVTRLSRIGQEIIDRGRRGITRCVVRAVMPEGVLGDILDNPETSHVVEGAVPTQFVSQANGRPRERLWMMLAAINHRSRTPLYPVSEMIAQVDQARRPPGATPAERATQVREEGYRFIHTIPPERVGEIQALWGDSFEWDQSGIVHLEKTLKTSQYLRPNARNVWFSGLIEPDTNRLAAIATAERLDIPVEDGHVLPLIESTEWRRSDAVRRHGLAAAVVSHLHAQVLEDLYTECPTIIAETNYRSGAHHVGFAAGMDVPTRILRGRMLPQMLIQNVRVGDGFVPDRIRDFTLMHVSDEAVQTLYSPASRHAVLKGGI